MTTATDTKTPAPAKALGVGFFNHSFFSNSNSFGSRVGWLLNVLVLVIYIYQPKTKSGGPAAK